MDDTREFKINLHADEPDLHLEHLFVVLTVPAIGIGVMVAPAIGGLLTGDRDFTAVLWVGGVAALLAPALSLTAIRLGAKVRV